MATETSAELSPTSKESAKLLIPMEEEEILDKKQLVIMTLGYLSLVMALMSLVFPLWADNTPILRNFVSLWRITYSGIPYYHWNVIWNWQIFLQYVFLSIFFVLMLSSVLILMGKSVWKLIRHDWKKPIERVSFFWISVLILLMIVLISFFVPEFDMSSNPGFFSVLYGPTWGFAFGWYALLIAGIIEIVRKKLNQMIEKSKIEEKEGFLS
ncbi:MAG: hypothetical protein ACFFD2_07765 [Promethearchaeota archaeon]